MNSKIKPTTKTKALSLAQKYLQTLGFSGFSFQTIADHLGIKKASLHYYFASKDDMGLALIDHYEVSHKEWAMKVKDLDSKTKLLKMVKGFRSLCHKNNMICPVGALSSDYNNVSKKMKVRLKEFHLVIRAWLVETIDQGKKEKSISMKKNSEVLADLFMTALQGGVQVARVRGEQESFEQMIQYVLDSIYDTK
jgi:TetR/AcrR family transcriptional repressor of nem operon